MSEQTAISWCESTFNPWIGCTKVSPACDHCYAERLMDQRWHRVRWGAGQQRQRTGASTWQTPLYWNSKHQEFERTYGRRRRVFCASLADVFDNEVPPEWQAELFDLIHTTPNLDWLLLTKRIGNAAAMLRDSAPWDPSKPPANVWLGATICNQEEADRDIPKLLAVPARVRFLSIEPMLGPVDLTAIRVPLAGESYTEGNVLAHKDSLNLGAPRAAIDWVICGGESGPQARPMHPDWVRSLRDQCAAAGVPFHFKQWGEWCPRGPESLGYSSVDGVPRFRMTDAGENGQDIGSNGGDDVWMNRAGIKAAGRLLDGAEHNGFPGDSA